MLAAETILQRLTELLPTERFRVLNVCGGHERAISRSGLRTMLDHNIELIPGPGCPVCICPEEDIATAISIAIQNDVILLSFGDMLRVPIYQTSCAFHSLQDAKSHGADIQPIASPLEVLSIAHQNPDKRVVFFAVGFETTMAPIAAMLLQDIPDNVSILLSGRLTWPAVSYLLKDNSNSFDALIAPGHVATVMGIDEWKFVADDYHLPIAVAGFHPESLLLALHSLLEQKSLNKYTLSNCYQELVKSTGNAHAQACIWSTMRLVDANWRGIGVIPDSGLVLRPELKHLDAHRHFDIAIPDKTSAELPPGALCSEVVMGKQVPTDCPLYGNACTPRTAVGACMVSDEGACRIWWSTVQDGRPVKARVIK